MPRHAARKTISGGFYATIQERLLGAPEFVGLTSMADAGLYFIMLGKSDVYGCIQAFPQIEPTRAHIMGALLGMTTTTSFRSSLKTLLDARLVLCIEHAQRTTFLLPHKLPTKLLQYYPAPRILPASMVYAHIQSAATEMPYLSELCNGFPFERIMPEDGEMAVMGTETMPEWLFSPAERKVRQERHQRMIPALPEQSLPEQPAISDIRVIQAQEHIRANGFDINISDRDMLALIIEYGEKYTTLMLDAYGDWRLNNPNKAKKHVSHIRALRQVWVHEKVRLQTLPNPNDKLIQLKYNVLVHPADLNALREAIRDKLGCTDPDNIEQYLMEFSDRVSGWKRKSEIITTDSDGNYILSRIEQQQKYNAIGGK